MNRRRVLGWVATLGGGALASALLVPVVGYLADPFFRKRRQRGAWRTVAKASALEAERPVALPVFGAQNDAWTRSEKERLGTVWVRRTKAGRLLALSAECPHLGCQIGWDADHDRFLCPCHDARFDKDGRVLGGPSPRAMDTLDVRIRGGSVEVKFERFRTQKSTKEPLS